MVKKEIKGKAYFSILVLDRYGLDIEDSNSDEIKELDWEDEDGTFEAITYNKVSELNDKIYLNAKVAVWNYLDAEDVADFGETSNSLGVAVRITHKVNGKEVHKYIVFYVNVRTETSFEISGEEEIN